MTIMVLSNYRESAQNEKFILGTVGIENPSIFIRKKQSFMPEANRWVTVSASFWDFKDKKWEIDNSLLPFLDQEKTFFNVIENPAQFWSMLNEKQSEYNKDPSNFPKYTP